VRSSLRSFGAVSLILAGLVSEALAQVPEAACRAPGTATRERPAVLAPQSFGGVVGKGDLQLPDNAALYDEIPIAMAGNALLEFDLLLRYRGIGAGLEYRIELDHDSLGEPGSIIRRNNRNLLSNKIHWDTREKTVVDQAEGLPLVTVKARGRLRVGVAKATELKLRLISFMRRGFTYSLRVDSLPCGDAGTHLDAGVRPEAALPVPFGEPVAGRLPFWDSYMETPFSDPLDRPPVIFEGRGGPEASVPPEPEEPQIPFSSDYADLYRLPDVEPGTRVRARVLATEFDPALPYDREQSEVGAAMTIEIKRVRCTADGRVYLEDTVDDDDGVSCDEWGDCYHQPEAEPEPEPVDTYVSSDGGELFVEVRGDGPVRYRFRVDTETTPKLAHLVRLPPLVGLEVASYPRDPVPGAPITVALRAQNTGARAAPGVVVELQLADRERGADLAGLASVEGRCEEPTPGTYRCKLGDMEPGAVRDLHLDGAAPASGAVLWRTSLEAEGRLAGALEARGTLGSPAPPRIVAVVPVEDDTIVTEGVPSYRYPFGPGGSGDQSRHLLVVGRGLPKRSGGRIELEDEPGLHYGFMAFPDSGNAFHRELFGKGWRRFYGTERVGEARALAEADGYDAVLLRADLRAGVMPGAKRLRLGGLEGAWELRFGGLSARLHVLRRLPGGGFDRLEEAYVPERVHLALETSVRLPVDELPMTLDRSRLGAGEGEVELLLRRSELEGGRMYLSAPLDLHAKGKEPSLGGGQGTPVGMGAPGARYLRARLDPDVVAERFLMPVDPPALRLPVRRTPSRPTRSWLWKDVLMRAATCHEDLPAQDWGRLTAAESKRFTNWVVLTRGKHELSQSAKFGHHAAALMLRDMFLEVLEPTIVELRRVRKAPREMLGLVRYLGTAGWFDESALMRMKVEDFGGGRTDLRWALANDEAWMADRHGVPTAKVRAWRLRVMDQALAQLIQAAETTRARVMAIEDCEVEELLRLTGFHFEPVRRRLKARLVELAETRVAGGLRRPIWMPDDPARYWVDGVAPLARTLKEQRKRARVDNDVLLLGAFLATAPLMFAEQTGVVLALWAIDLLDLGVTCLQEVAQYLESRAELEIASGAALVLGERRHEEAKREAKSLGMTALAIGGSLFGAAMGSLDAVPRLVALRRAARGRRVARELERGSTLEGLSDVQRRDYCAFAAYAWHRFLAEGWGRLTALERRTARTVEASQASSPGAAVPEVPRVVSGVRDVTELAAPIHFGEVLETGHARMAGPVETVAPPGRGVETLPPPGRGAETLPPPRRTVETWPPPGRGVETLPPPRRTVETLPPPADGPGTFDMPPGWRGAGRGDPARRSGAAPSQPGGATGTFDMPTGWERSGRALPDPSQPDFGPSPWLLVVRFARGGVEALVPGRRLGGRSSTSLVFEFADDPTGKIIRITLTREGSVAFRLDMAGERAIRSLEGSTYLRPLRVDRDLQFPGMTVQGQAVRRVVVAERVTPALEELGGGSWASLGRMNAAQREAYLGAIRELNAEGFVWLDNKADNFAFVPREGGGLQVVIFDPGGIVPLRADIARKRRISLKRLAEQAQATVNGSMSHRSPSWDQLHPLKQYVDRRQEFFDHFGGAVDYDQLGIGPDDLAFNPRAGEDFHYLREEFPRE
jgi:hypothetical protein